MGRPKLLRTDKFPYHVFARANNKEHFPINLFSLWEYLVRQATETVERFAFQFHALVLMPNHIHALISTPDQNLDCGMHFLQKQLSNRINFQSGRINHLWGGRYKWSLIETEYYYEQVFRYVYQNPLRAGICSSVEFYPYSSWNPDRIQNLNVSIIPPHFPTPRFLRKNKNDLSKWMNEVPEAKINKFITDGLRRRKFKLSSRCPVL
jgi:putative transposase